MKETGYILLGISLIAMLWDFYTDLRYGIKSTESWFIRDTASKHPFFVLNVGMLMGHLFTNMIPSAK